MEFLYMDIQDTKKYERNSGGGYNLVDNMAKFSILDA
jgi:hypothetical protein